jgi:hypothetical protein
MTMSLTIMMTMSLRQTSRIMEFLSILMMMIWRDHIILILSNYMAGYGVRILANNGEYNVMMYKVYD